MYIYTHTYTFVFSLWVPPQLLSFTLLLWPFHFRILKWLSVLSPRLGNSTCLSSNVKALNPRGWRAQRASSLAFVQWNLEFKPCLRSRVEPSSGGLFSTLFVHPAKHAVLRTTRGTGTPEPQVWAPQAAQGRAKQPTEPHSMGRGSQPSSAVHSYLLENKHINSVTNEKETVSAPVSSMKGKTNRSYHF